MPSPTPTAPYEPDSRVLICVPTVGTVRAWRPREGAGATDMVDVKYDGEVLVRPLGIDHLGGSDAEELAAMAARLEAQARGLRGHPDVDDLGDTRTTEPVTPSLRLGPDDPFWIVVDPTPRSEFRDMSRTSRGSSGAGCRPSAADGLPRRGGGPGRRAREARVRATTRR